MTFNETIKNFNNSYLEAHRYGGTNNHIKIKALDKVSVKFTKFPSKEPRK